ncbi:hypothetical protein ACS0TY_022471 [Phlomoides rotata]
MADFFTDSDDDKAVEELLSQAMDATVLEQVSAINCAGFTDSDLPSHLETRFQKLKSFPSSTVKPNSLSSKSFHHSHPPEFRTNETVNEAKDPDSSEEKNGEDSEKMPSTCLTKSPEVINCAGFTDSDLPSHLETRFQKLKSFPSSTVKPNSLSSKSLHHSHPPEFRKNETVNEAKDPDSSEEKNGEDSENMPSTCLTKSPEAKSCLSDGGSLSPFKKIPQGKFEKKGAKSPSFSSSDGSVSPPSKIGCFLCSPKKVSRKKNKENRGLDLGLDWGKHDEFLSDVSNFSLNNQRKMIKKAMEEEEKICREAEKIVKWAKQASARMDVSGIEDELSDEENHKFH